MAVESVLIYTVQPFNPRPLFDETFKLFQSGRGPIDNEIRRAVEAIFKAYDSDQNPVPVLDKIHLMVHTEIESLCHEGYSKTYGMWDTAANDRTHHLRECLREKSVVQRTE